MTQALFLYHQILCSYSFTNASNYGVCVKEYVIMNGYVDAVQSLCVPVLVACSLLRVNRKTYAVCTASVGSTSVHQTPRLIPYTHLHVVLH